VVHSDLYVIARHSLATLDHKSSIGISHRQLRLASLLQPLQVLADEGYYSSAGLKGCEDDGIEVYLPASDGNQRLEKEGRFGLKSFSYDAAADAYTCPTGELLHAMEGRRTSANGRIEVRYASSKKTCGTCELKARCLSAKAIRRIISRWEHEDVLDRHRERMEGA